jgi:hypothetical protein
MRKILAILLWIGVVLLAIKLTAIAVTYFFTGTDNEFLLTKQDLLHNLTWKVAFYGHLLGGSVAVVSGTLAFFIQWIKPSSKGHKILGKIYFLSIMFIGGPTGLYLGFYAESGYLATIGFIGMSCAWMVPTFIAVYKITKGDIAGHHKWMIRSYSMTLAGVTLRLMTPMVIYFLEWSYDTTFIVTAYVPWMFNLALAELIIYLKRDQIISLASTLKITRK